MSDPPLPPPPPSAAPPFGVLPLDYAIARPRRPGLLTAIAILSIILGSFGALFNLFGIVQAYAFYTLSTGLAAVPATPVPNVTTTPTTAATSGPATSLTVTVNASPVFFSSPMRRATTLATGATAAINTALAIYLLVIGILVLRGSPRGARLHRIYAWARIVFAVITAAVTALWYRDVLGFARATSVSGPPSYPIMIASFVAFQTAIRCIYPVALLITLRARSIRAFYGGLVPESLSPPYPPLPPAAAP